MTAPHTPEPKLDFDSNPTDVSHTPLPAEARGPSSYRPASINMSTEFNLDSIPRSASYTQLPVITRPDASFERNGVKRTFSENLIANPKSNTFRHASILKSSKRIIKPDDQHGQNGLSRKLSAHPKSSPRITISGFQLGVDEDDSDISYQRTPKANIDALDTHTQSRSVSSSLARLKRQSWIAPSRSPSPSKRAPPEQRPNTADGATNRVSPSSPPKTANDPNHIATPKENVPSPTERVEIQRKKSRRRISSYLSMASLSDGRPKTPVIPQSLSTDRLPLSHTHTSSERPPSLPTSKSFELLSSIGTESPRRKDDLWSAFRSLDADFQKFQSRSSSMKCAVVRTALLPFLRNHIETLPNFTLRPEDLDRRVNVLNRWWTGLLEMINGRNGESVSGSDRPTILDAVTAIMVRPEWSVAPSTNPSRSPKPSLKSRSTTSLRSTTSDFLTESVMHNIRNTYVQNLLAQMAFVVNKLSVRSVPASVVAFCGRAIAYAFFYCDGVAEILVRLWSISSNTLRRACEAGGIRRGASICSASEKITTRFPGCVQKLAFSSSRSLIRYLRNRPQVPMAATYIPWDGPWIGRWAGRDTDLFYSFTKQYYDLLSQHLPEDASREEIFCAPGHALLQAQLLSLLDAAILHTSTQPLVDAFRPPSIDDALAEADVSAAVLPISPSTMVRSMAENRLIMLLRDCLSANDTFAPKARAIFAETFQCLLKATAARTSQFDHHACSTLCDFLEEAIVIFVRFHHSAESTLGIFDWPFWIRVCKLMLASDNSMIEIRICTFLYSLWGTIVGDEQRKRDFCLGWLLSEETFGRQFNHWCPMVRAYFMRLLIWRMSRLDGTASHVNSEILATLSLRLHRVWRHYLYVKHDAERLGSVAPTTAPCSPAPSRCLLIIRNEAPTPPTFLSFDSILPPSQSNPSQRANPRDSLFFTPPPLNAKYPREGDRPGSGVKRRWGLLKTILPFANTPGKEVPASPAASKYSTLNSGPAPSPTRSDLSATRQSSFNPHLPVAAPAVNKSLQAVAEYRTHSFKFSLEWLERGQLPSRDKRLYPPKLPSPAQMYLKSDNIEQHDDTPLMPVGTAAGESKYTGRALAEWSLLIAECHSFFERRKQEGVPDDSRVETPTLSVESFRKI